MFQFKVFIIGVLEPKERPLSPFLEKDTSKLYLIKINISILIEVIEQIVDHDYYKAKTSHQDIRVSTSNYKYVNRCLKENGSKLNHLENC